MKITKNLLRQIIREEVSKLHEQAIPETIAYRKDLVSKISDEATREALMAIMDETAKTINMINDKVDEHRDMYFREYMKRLRSQVKGR